VLGLVLTCSSVLFAQGDLLNQDYSVTPGLSGYNGSGVESYEVRFSVKFLQESFLSFTRNNLRFVVRGVFGGSFVAVASFLAARRVRLYPQRPNHVIFLENPSAPFVRSSCQNQDRTSWNVFSLVRTPERDKTL